VPKYTYGFTNECGFPVSIGMIVEGQGDTAAGPLHLETGAHRTMSVFSKSESAIAELIVDALAGDAGHLNGRKFAVGLGDVEHASDPSRPFEITVEGELCEGLDPGVGG